jgi:signal transduction histidine kinase
LNVPDELLSDKETKKKKPDEPWEIVNGPIRNFLLEALDLKTTQIQVEIDRDGQLVLTKLTDRGNEIYELLERNPNPDILKDIKISLFFMNRAAKSAFTRRMGLEPVKYGSVFLYKNGFRIHPFGDAGEDGLDIDKRKQQGLFRRLGTRDLSGRIEINGANPEFRETSSRDGGLIKNAAFYALKNFFQEFVLNRLEAYVMNVARYGVLGDQPEITDPNLPQLREETLELIKKLTRSKDIVDFNFDPKVLDLIESKSPDNLSGLIKNLKRISVESNNLELSKEIDKAEKRVLELLKAKEEAERTEEEERQRAINAEQKVQQAIEKAEEAEELARKASTEAEEARLREEMLQTQNIFLKGALSRDLQHVLTLHHSIGQNALNIEQYVTNILRLISTDRIDDVQRLKRYLTGISFSAKKIDSISRFATRANFRAEIEEMTSDLIGFIREYLLNVYEGSIEDPDGDLVPIKFTQPNNIAFVTKFAPLNVSMIFDNLLSNSRKHGAREVTVNILECKSDHLKISFADDGRGIPSKYLPQLFKLGFSTTDGSGLGLYHVQELMTKMKGGISVNPDRETGAEFILDFAKRP